MKTTVQIIKNNDVAEIYITAVPTLPVNGDTQDPELFCSIAQVLRQNHAYILQERIFVTDQTRETAASARAKIYGELNDGVSPTWLVSGGASGSVLGIQVHAVAGCGTPDVLRLGHTPCGRIARIPGIAYLTLSNIQQPTVSGAANQAKAMLQVAESVLQDAGVNFSTVPRTWMWLKDILTWYDVFNRVRNSFFKERGIITGSGDHKMPASTAIGIHTGNGSVCAMELAAVAGQRGTIEYLDVGGNQRSAFDYGSAFSRACKTRTLAGETLYVSGTASIAADGRTLHLGDAQAQIKATIDNVRAVLEECEYRNSDIVHAIAYCKTPQVQQALIEGHSDLDWPIVTVIADVCRDDLLFEIEVTAAKDA